MDFQEILNMIAAETDIAEDKIYLTIQKMIDDLWKDPSPKAKVEREKLGLGEEAPTVEDLLTRIYPHVAGSRNEETLC